MRISDWSSDVCSSDLVGRASAADRCRRYPVREENFSSVCCFLPFVPENRRIWIIDDQIEIEGNARFGHCADTPFAFPFTDTERPRPYDLLCRIRFGGGTIILRDMSHRPDRKRTRLKSIH